MARIGELQLRFGVPSNPGVSPVGVADFSGFSVDEVVDLVTAETEKIAGRSVAGAVEASLLDALAVHRGDAGLGSSQAPTLTGTDPALSVLPHGSVKPAGPLFDGSAVFPVPGFQIGSAFGERSDPFEGDTRMHKGVDIGAPEGTPVVAAGGGRVTWAGPRGSYGNLVVIKHDDHTETRYAHQASLNVVAGDVVGRGQIIGEVGSTGRSTGPHLHFEARVNGDAVDPVAWIEDHQS